MVINRRKLWKTVLQSWGFTLMGVFNIVVLLLFASLLAARFAGSGVLVAVIMPTFAFSIAAFLLGDVVVNIIFDARVPHPEHDRRFIESMKRMRKKSRMWIMPRGRIMQIGQPNAMAY
ncbi:MAG TPA: hypothetical protein VHD38_02380, partial [Candidatus Paceibacterota bacterium]|nr:hypothetical protein [Candidatus Paceibacterota bacterium]